MSKKVYYPKQTNMKDLIKKLVLSAISYAVGWVFFAAVSGADIGLRIAGLLLLCGLPYMIGRKSRKMEKLIAKKGKEVDGKIVVVVKKKRRKDLLMRFVYAILGLALGIVLTPYLMIQYVIAIVKLSKSQSDPTAITDDNLTAEESNTADTSESPQAQGPRFCVNCGAKLTTEMKFCPVCGAQCLTYDTTSLPESDGNEPLTVTDLIKSNEVSGRLWLLRIAAAASIFIVIAVNIIVQFMFNGNAQIITYFYPAICAVFCAVNLIFSIVSIKTPVKRKTMNSVAISSALFCLFSLILLFVFNLIFEAYDLSQGLIILIPQVIIVIADIVFFKIGMGKKLDYKTELSDKKLKTSYVLSAVAVVLAIVSIISPVYIGYNKIDYVAEKIDCGMYRSDVENTLGTPDISTDNYIVYYSFKVKNKVKTCLNSLSNEDIENQSALTSVESYLSKDSYSRITVFFENERTCEIFYDVYKKGVKNGTPVALSADSEGMVIARNNTFSVNYMLQYEKAWHKGYTSDITFENIYIDIAHSEVEIVWKLQREGLSTESFVFESSITHYISDFYSLVGLLHQYDTFFAKDDYKDKTPEELAEYDEFLENYNMVRSWTLDDNDLEL
ncbi:MAG TPA: zinc-ribbon domain-containing protein [Candidatus Faecicola pullistercoris]|nr:zinc-ribbon domain-containing protein [Candidatus Faecicola pullistercoris]